MSISVIIPAYNEESFLPTLLSSLHHALRCLHDKRPGYPVEIIVVDNCSTDRTAEVAISYSANVVLEEKRNVSAVRNRGAREAKGEYILFIDSDYRVRGDFFDEIVTAFESCNAIVAMGVKVSIEKNDLDPIQRNLANFALLLLRYIKNMSFGIFAFRKSYFEHLGGFDEQFYAYEDVEMHDLVKYDLHRSIDRKYKILHHVQVYTSARGFYRGKMISTYIKMFLSRKSRKNPGLCAYWYEH